MDNIGKLLLRLGIGGLMIFHGIGKIQPGFDLQTGLKGIMEGLTARGFPPEMAYGVYGGEILAPVLIVLGVWTRLSALAMACTMGMAVYLVHSQDFLKLGAQGAWALEQPGFYFLGALALACLGPGTIAIQGESSESPEKPQ